MSSAGERGDSRRLLFLFLDGVGLGSADAAVNPFITARTPFMHELLGGPLSAGLPERTGEVVFRQLDATLGHPGLPQSATGQATLLTGSNCADMMDGHYGPWPGPTLKVRLDQGTLFSEAATAGPALLANAYPPGYFEAIASGRARVNVPVHAAQSAGLNLADLQAYRKGEAIAADLDGRHFAASDPQLPSTTPAEAGSRLAQLAGERLFTFFDFWLSDRVGHRGSFAEAVELAERLDAFLRGVFTSLGEVTLLLTSDHGNMEDKSTRGHTRAPVPLVVAGPQSSHFGACEALPDVAPAARRAMSLDD